MASSDSSIASLSGLASPQKLVSSKSSEKTELKLRHDGAEPVHDSSWQSPERICRICERVFQRTNHLLRHLKSHEDARQYQCSKCPKRFNRPDLATRHEAIHNRAKAGNRHRGIRRKDRAAEACLACARSKAKCDDQKPCSRCQAKNLLCQTSSKKCRGYEIILTEMSSPPEGDGLSKDSFEFNSGSVDSEIDGFVHDASCDLIPGIRILNDTLINMPGQVSSMDSVNEGMVPLSPINNLFEDVDVPLTWDTSFESIAFPQIWEQEFVSEGSVQLVSTPSNQHLTRYTCCGHAAFERSPLLWEPRTREDYVAREREHLEINEKTISRVLALERRVEESERNIKVSSMIRDKLFSLILVQNRGPPKTASFPSGELLNYLIEAHFMEEESKYDDWLHASSFNPEDTSSELLGAVIASGAMYTSVPAIWQFGLALQEVIRLGTTNAFELNNNATRGLQSLQAFMLYLDIGIWSGLKRKMEIAESFLQPLLTMLRRGGMFSVAQFLAPNELDTMEVLDKKWKRFIELESFKRLALHLFFHDTQTSIGFQRSPLISYTELHFGLPASRDLWRAPTAIAWRDVYLRKKPSLDEQIPRLSEVIHSVNLLDNFTGHVDKELCYIAILHGFWGQTFAYKEAVRFYTHAAMAEANSTHRLWLQHRYRELYKDLKDFSAVIFVTQNSNPSLAITLELFMMILHVSPDELQAFAGKGGREEFERSVTLLQEHWADSREARYAVWHAGQVLRNVRRLPPRSLRGFNAWAGYFASLTLWTYGLLSSSQPERIQEDSSMVLIDGEQNTYTEAFIQLNRGTPGLMRSAGKESRAESLSRPGSILLIVTQLFRDNFPILTDPVPPLVESLGNLLRDLGTGTGGQLSGF